MLKKKNKEATKKNPILSSKHNTRTIIINICVCVYFCNAHTLKHTFHYKNKKNMKATQTNKFTYTYNIYKYI